MTTIIIPTRHRLDLLRRCLASLEQTNKKPDRTIIVVDADPETLTWAQEQPGIEVIYNEETTGFWQSINKALETVPDNEPFCYFGKDVVFDPAWLTYAELCFNKHYSTGLGLISFKDDIVDGGNASHGMTTKRWLEVLYGHNHFPLDYFHWFCDSELTVRSKGFGRYTYCADSYVAHKHEPSGHTGKPNQPDDYLTQNARHEAWVNGGREEAEARLRSLV